MSGQQELLNNVHVTEICWAALSSQALASSESCTMLVPTAGPTISPGSKMPTCSAQVTHLNFMVTLESQGLFPKRFYESYQVTDRGSLGKYIQYLVMQTHTPALPLQRESTQLSQDTSPSLGPKRLSDDKASGKSSLKRISQPLQFQGLLRSQGTFLTYWNQL